ncbi:MAG: sodium-dependent transporter [Myxococcales bacterium]|nr:sodium-dependent transporter [Myxococcales bacterium]
MSGSVEVERASAKADGWGSRLGVILAVAGSAVGLGNFLRFPGQAAQNGGGAFMIPYFVSLFILGIPIGWAEWTLGRKGGAHGYHSAPAILGRVSGRKAFRYLGVIGVLIPLVVYMYYVLIESWCLYYAVQYVIGGMDLGTDPGGYAKASEAVFTRATGIGGNGQLFAHGLETENIVLIVVLALNVWLCYRGLSAGIEKFCTYAMPVMALCAVVVLIRVLTLGTPDPTFPERNVLAGLGYMWNPDFSRLWDFKTWLAAAGQIFFSLSVGFGVIINYASYLRRKDDVVLNGLTATATNELFEVGFGGMITIPAAFVFLGASGAVGGTFGLGFNTLPVVFQYLGAFGRWVGAIWFSMLFLAAITSSLSMLQPVTAFLTESLGVSRRRATSVLVGLVVPGVAWVMWFSKDLTALDTMDFWVGTTLIFVMGSLQLWVFAWVFGAERGIAEANHGSDARIPTWFRWMFRWVSPLFLLVVFVGFCIQSLPGYLKALGANPIALWTLAVVGAVAGVLVTCVWRAEGRWATDRGTEQPAVEEAE